jgi:hypothetical protein
VVASAPATWPSGAAQRRRMPVGRVPRAQARGPGPPGLAMAGMHRWLQFPATPRPSCQAARQAWTTPRWRARAAPRGSLVPRQRPWAVPTQRLAPPRRTRPSSQQTLAPRQWPRKLRAPRPPPSLQPAPAAPKPPPRPTQPKPALPRARPPQARRLEAPRAQAPQTGAAQAAAGAARPQAAARGTVAGRPEPGAAPIAPVPARTRRRCASANPPLARPGRRGHRATTGRPDAPGRQPPRGPQTPEGAPGAARVRAAAASCRDVGPRAGPTQTGGSPSCRHARPSRPLCSRPWAAAPPLPGAVSAMCGGHAGHPSSGARMHRLKDRAFFRGTRKASQDGPDAGARRRQEVNMREDAQAPAAPRKQQKDATTVRRQRSPSQRLMPCVT